MSKKVSFLISILVSVICIFIIMTYVNDVDMRIKGEYELVPVLRAVQDIPKLSILQDNMVESHMVPKKYAEPGAIQSKLDIRGKIADLPIKQFETISTGKIVIPNRKTGLSFQLESGRRAITIAVNDVTGVAGLIRPFDRVDILLITRHGNSDVQDKRINLLYQDVLILATGENLGTGVPSSTEKDEITDAIKFVDPDNKRYMNVTLSVTPKQAMGLVLLQESAQLHFALRPAYSSKNVNVDPLNIEDVTGYKTPVKQVARPAWMTLRNSSINF